MRCPTGQARITTGAQLPARHVIHTAGPIWLGGDNDEAELLAACYHACLELARAQSLHSIAFPAISCGIYGYPPEHAIPIAIQSVRSWSNDAPMQVIFCCYDQAMADRYRSALGNE